MKRLVVYLQKHLDGEVLTSDDARRYFAQDASPLKIKPQIIIYPRHEDDVRKVFLWVDQLAQKGIEMPVTCRGAGTDLYGASLGSGIILVLSTHLNNLIEYESRSGYFQLQSGCQVNQWKQFLSSQNRFIPALKDGLGTATIGGAVANNSGSNYSLKYGRLGRYIDHLRVVLSNGEAIWAEKISRREVAKKVQQSTLEGEIYRQLVEVRSRHLDLIEQTDQSVTNCYDLESISAADGSFNLIPLFVGSQGTLGTITEVGLTTSYYNPNPLMLLLQCPDLENCLGLVSEIKKHRPAAIEMFDGASLSYIDQIAPSFFDGYQIDLDVTQALLIVEFDHHRRPWRQAKKVIKLATSYDIDCQLMGSTKEQIQIERLRRASCFILTDNPTANRRYLPGFNDILMPLDRLTDFYLAAKKLFDRHRLDLMMWGNVGYGQLTVMPALSLKRPADRQDYLQLLKKYFQLVTKHGGQISGFYNQGRLKAGFIKSAISPELYQIQLEVKQTFDPYGILNPNVKINHNTADNLELLKNRYNLGDLYQQLPKI